MGRESEGALADRRQVGSPGHCLFNRKDTNSQPSSAEVREARAGPGRLQSLSHGAHYDTSFHFAPDDDGTLVTFQFDAKALTKTAKVMSVLFMPIMKRSIIKCVTDDLQDIKKAVEAESI